MLVSCPADFGTPHPTPGSKRTTQSMLSSYFGYVNNPMRTVRSAQCCEAKAAITLQRNHQRQRTKIHTQRHGGGDILNKSASLTDLAGPPTGARGRWPAGLSPARPGLSAKDGNVGRSCSQVSLGRVHHLQVPLQVHHADLLHHQGALSILSSTGICLRIQKWSRSCIGFRI